MTNEELFAVLRPIVMLATGVPECILADQAGPGSMPAPKGPYATITPRQSVSERGQANIISPYTDGHTWYRNNLWNSIRVDNQRQPVVNRPDGDG